MLTYRMSLLSAGSISLDSTFNCVQEAKGLAVKEKASLAEVEKRLHDCQLEKQELLDSR
jgi:hypothetical protein